MGPGNQIPAITNAAKAKQGTERERLENDSSCKLDQAIDEAVEAHVLDNEDTPIEGVEAHVLDNEDGHQEFLIEAAVFEAVEVHHQGKRRGWFYVDHNILYQL
ncbi:hypothetical protein NE237_005535 [Protea cynaroides]|uniref:Uncharacterized protein n=1 Tax=Protea cynaroides TaxID=273540 RepID=A0A9Q0KLI7_9MAGN|nr:hypothetical protein NE237_005535 [Protea cynaroides]